MRPVVIEARGCKVVPHPRAPDRLAEGTGGASAGAGSTTASCARCATCRSTSARASSSASSAERIGQEHAAEDPRQHLPRRRGPGPRRRPPRAVHRARGRLQPGADRARERRAQRRADGTHPAGGAARPRRGARVRRARGVRRPQAQELLVGHDGPLRVRRHGPGRRRRDADRRGARRRRRGVRQKCMDVFREKRRAGKTIVLVTHDMSTVQTLCHRAMLLHDGALELRRRARGRRTAVLPDQLRRADSAPRAAPGDTVVDVNARVVHAGLLGAGGEPVETSSRTRRSRSTSSSRPRASCGRPIFVFHLRQRGRHRRRRVRSHARRAGRGRAAGPAGRAGREPARARALLRSICSSATTATRAGSRCRACG